MKSVLALAVLSVGLSACSDQPEPVTLPPIEGALVRGINFNGAGGIEIDGYRWTSESDSKANGMMLREVESIASDLQPKPTPDEATISMLNGSIAKTGRLAIDQIMYGAEYDIYFWFMENQRSTQRSMTVEIEGQVFDEPIGNLAYRNWSRFGPYPVTLSDGELNMVLTTADPNQKAEVMGLLIIKPDNSGSL